MQHMTIAPVNNYYSKSHTLNKRVLDVDYLQVDGSTVTYLVDR